MSRPRSLFLAAALAAAFCCHSSAQPAAGPIGGTGLPTREGQTPSAGLPPGEAAVSPAPTDITFVRELAGIREFRVVANGLQVLLVRDTSAPVVTVMTTYHVGSRNEVVGTTGATHLLEHLFFKGTERFNRDRGNSLDQLLDRVGADNNATTSYDRTNYYVNAPSDQLPLVCDLLADHLRHLRLREEDRAPEMTVVRNEFENGENSPWMALNKAIWAAAYTAHPYHNPVIGWRSDIENVPIAKLRAFHDTYYWPNNCTLTIAGDFTEASALDTVRRHFAALPTSPHPIPELYTIEPEQEGPRRTVVHRPGQPGVVGVAFKRPGGLHPDSASLALLATALGDGMTSRLYRALVDTGLATEIFVDNNALRDPGLLLCYAMLAPGVPHERAEAALNAALHEVAEHGLTSEEIQRSRRQLAAQRAYKRDGGAAVAAELNESIALGDWTDFVTQADRLDAVTPADLQRVARETFAEPRSTTGWFIPTTEDDAPAGSASGTPPARSGIQYRRAPAADSSGTGLQTRGIDAISAPAAGTPFRRQIGGIDFVARPTGVKEVVTIVGSLAAGDAFSPADNTALALLTAALLDKGTVQHSKFALAETLAGMGATIEFGSDRLRVEFTARCLRADAPAVIALLAEQLRQPAIAPAEVAKEKARLAGELQQAMDQPGARAAIALSRALWPEGHPQRQPELARKLADLARTTPAEVAEFHRSHYGPRSLRLVAVGDLDPAPLAAAVERSFAGWVGGSDYPTPPKLPAPQTHGETVELPMAEKPSLTLLFGQTTGLQARDTDALALKLATHTLGGPTFTSRLISTIRDTEGLTYGIGARVAGDSVTEGTWFIRGTFDTTLLGKGEAATRRELAKWYERGITAEELAAQKTNYVGVFKLGLATSSGMAEALLRALECGEGPEAVDNLGARVGALTLTEVNAAIRRHLDPARMVVIKAGTLPGR